MIRVRFAPSPTGYMHIGNARTALFNWMYARKTGGVFLLRIEDTDRERSREEYEQAVLDDLEWLGIDWDEGPGAGGSYGPYRQSERLDIYAGHAEMLVEKGLAYPCYCTLEELEARREAARAGKGPVRYDNRCRRLSDRERDAFRAAGRRPALRFAVPERRIVVDDLVRGTCRFDTRLLGDFIILKADGMPTYHFAVVVDDALMEITHVIRGEGHLPNTPLHVMLFDAIGRPAPAFAHMSHTVSETGKLSKRSGALSIRHYRREGYLPEAVVNYIALLGWNPKRRAETFGIGDVLTDFDVRDLSRASARHDGDKMNFIAGWHMREKDAGELAAQARPFLEAAGLGDVDDEKLERIVLATRAGASTLKEVAELARRMVTETPLTEEIRRALADEQSQKVLREVLQALDDREELSAEGFSELVKSAGKILGIKGKALYHPLRLAVTGSNEGPDLALLAAVHGAREVARRLRGVIMERRVRGPAVD